MTVVDSTDLENDITGFEGGSVEGVITPLFAKAELALVA